MIQRGWQVLNYRNENKLQAIRWMFASPLSFSPVFVSKILQLTFIRSKVKRWLHTPGKYSLPWFPHRKQPCDVSDDPGARMRTINRKWLSSKLHPIIIKTKTQTNNPKSQQDTKWQITRTSNPAISAQTYNNPERNTPEKHKHPTFTQRALRQEENKSNATD